MIYLDNAATSYPKPARVYARINYCASHCGGNPGRSAHPLAMRAADEIYGAREALAAHLGAPSVEGIVFTMNATQSLNYAIGALARDGSHILHSDMEHNAVLRVVEKMCRERGCTHSAFPLHNASLESIEKMLTPKTSLLVCTLASNVTGERLPLALLSEVRKRHPGLHVIADGSQAFGHEKISLEETPVDAFCAPGHKGGFGIAGCGFAVFEQTQSLPPLIVGGSGSNSESPEMPLFLPDRMEAGTLPTPAIAALGEGVRFIDGIGAAKIGEKLSLLCAAAKETLGAIRDIRLYGGESGIVSFTHAKMPPDEIARLLGERGICVRSGLCCAPLAHRTLGTFPSGTVRVSFSYYNRLSEVARLGKELRRVLGA